VLQRDGVGRRESGCLQLQLRLDLKHFFGSFYPHQHFSQANLAVFDKKAKLIADILLPGPEISGCAIRDGFITIAEQSRKTLYRAAISGLLPTGSK
jgi:hypothetical protein